MRLRIRRKAGKTHLLRKGESIAYGPRNLSGMLKWMVRIVVVRSTKAPQTHTAHVMTCKTLLYMAKGSCIRVDYFGFPERSASCVRSQIFGRVGSPLDLVPERGLNFIKQSSQEMNPEEETETWDRRSLKH
jgi:hypothetical protein